MIQQDALHPTLSAFVDRLQASGQYTFDRSEALEALGCSRVALMHAARRLVAKGRLAVPRRGFYVIVPLEYRQSGAPPPAWYIHDLMAHQGYSYYVGLLSAAALHGAAHQKPQEFQVMTDVPLRSIRVGRARIHYFIRRELAGVPTIAVKTPTGTMRVSTPEATAFDLVRYADRIGNLNQVATVLAELAEKLEPRRLVELAGGEVELSVTQRLGYLLEHVDAADVASPLAAWLERRGPRPVPLLPARDLAGATRNARWQVLVNEHIEIDEI